MGTVRTTLRAELEATACRSVAAGRNPSTASSGDYLVIASHPRDDDGHVEFSYAAFGLRVSADAFDDIVRKGGL